MPILRQRLCFSVIVVFGLHLAAQTLYACSTSVNPNNPGHDPIAENFEQAYWFFRGAMLLLLANVVLAFVLTEKYWYGLGFLATSVVLKFVVLFGSLLLGDTCGIAFQQTIKTEFYVLIAVLVIQGLAWAIKMRNSREVL